MFLICYYLKKPLLNYYNYLYWDDRPIIVTRSIQMTRPQFKRRGRLRGARGRPTPDAQVKG